MERGLNASPMPARHTVDSQMNQMEGTLGALEETVSKLFDRLGNAGLLYYSNPEKTKEEEQPPSQAGILERINGVTVRLGLLNDRAAEIHGRVAIN